ncbi:hypothetical protein EYZ11_008075 [Aspergillus tanneri]|nr:hypothetical protein EYZ11_008075 [Aspergillus tanneri]
MAAKTQPIDKVQNRTKNTDEDNDENTAACSKGGEGEVIVSILQLLYDFVEIDDAVEEGEDFGG